MAKLKISSPWVSHYHELEAFFQKDPEVHVVYDEDENVVKLFVDNSAKAAALDQLIAHQKEWGGVVLNIQVVPANGFRCTARPQLYQDALGSNPALSYIQTVSGILSNTLTYVVFKHEVVQYWNDNLGDAHGLCSALYQEIAKDIFAEQEGVFFCTDVALDSVSLGQPLGEWP